MNALILDWLVYSLVLELFLHFGTKRDCYNYLYSHIVYIFSEIRHRVNLPIKLTKIYIETFLVHKIWVSEQKVMLK